MNNQTIDNNPFGTDGAQLDVAYAERMDRLIRGADALGMVVIVSFFYGAQTRFLRDGKAVRQAVVTASEFLRDGGYTNVLIEVANELNIGDFKRHPIIQQPQGMASLIDLARASSGGIAVGCSGGGYLNREVAEASDFVLIHGNGTTRQRYYNMIQEVRSWGLNQPIVCNEDSQAIGQIDVAFETRTSWGYYNKHDEAGAANGLVDYQRGRHFLRTSNGDGDRQGAAAAGCRGLLLPAGPGAADELRRRTLDSARQFVSGIDQLRAVLSRGSAAIHRVRRAFRRQL